MSMRDKAKKFGPVEVLVVVLVCLFVIAIVGPAAQMSRFEEYRMACTNNLSQIGRAMLIYANDYEDELPRSGGRNSVWTPTIPDWRANTRESAYGLSRNSGGQANISSCFYLLVKYTEVTPRTFVCPGDVGTTEFKLTDVDMGFGGLELINLWDFGPEAGKHCSYAYHMPFGIYALSMSDDPGLAVAADRNPWMDSPAAFAKGFPGPFHPDAASYPEIGGREAVKYGNAISHEEEGQNVLFLDGHVTFKDHSFCGIYDDNIYTYWDGGDIRIGSSPVLGSEPPARMDSLLVHDPIQPVGTMIIKESQVLDSADLKQTSVVATLDSPLPKYQNIIWCSTFQMTWDILKNHIIGEPVEVPGAEELADLLNSAEFSDKDIENESYFAAAGLLGEGIIEEIQDEMAQLFPSEPAPVFNDMNGLLPEMIIAYSFLNTDIEFEHPFYVNNRRFDFQSSDGMVTEVASFCSRSFSDSSDMVREQVDILYYKPGDQGIETEFAVDLCKYTNPYQVVLACVPQHKTLGKTVAYVEQKFSEFMQDPSYEELRKLQPITLHSRYQRRAETLVVPDVLYKLTHHFAELEGRAIGNQPWLEQVYLMGKAMQVTDFTLGMTGIILNSDRYIFVPISGGLQQPRHFHFNRPFLIYIKKRELSASPFFVMWVNNAELMQKCVFESPH